MNRNSNFAQKSSNVVNYINNMSTGRKIFVLILVGIIVIVLFYWAYHSRAAHNAKVANEFNLTNYININNNSNPSTMPVNGSSVGNELTLSFWLNINNYAPNGQSPYQLLTVEQSSNVILDLEVDNTSNNLIVTGSQYNGDPNPPTLTNIPFYTWTHYVVTLNNRNVNVYMNGALVLSSLSPQQPAHSTTYSVIIGGQETGTFDATLSNVYYFSREISPEEVIVLFNQAPTLKKQKNKKNN
jgi:hypothetical protein